MICSGKSQLPLYLPGLPFVYKIPAALMSRELMSLFYTVHIPI